MKDVLIIGLMATIAMISVALGATMLLALGLTAPGALAAWVTLEAALVMAGGGLAIRYVVSLFAEHVT